MDIHQLKTFVAVAREGSITRASERLHLSQPAVSAHIKTMEDTLGLSLFDRTARGMTLTNDGQRLLAKAEQTLAAHQDLMAEATRKNGELSGALRIGAGSNSNNEPIGRLFSKLAERFPRVEVVLKHRSSQEVVAGILNGTLDAGFYNEPGEASSELSTIDVGHFTIHVVAAPGLIAPAKIGEWREIAALPWIYPTESACCNRAAEALFAEKKFRPRRIISADRQDVTKTLIVSRLGVGLLHDEAARDAEQRGEVELLFEMTPPVRVLFAYLASRAADPLLLATSSIMRATAQG
ncbi:MAG: LysR family transcriptional regulator [Sandaracinaceae bacterium]|jgi:molybdate transport repressor ModE-like protein|nr:LysR family transcriptional regulator [Sandaracinaceae bacterium]